MDPTSPSGMNLTKEHIHGNDRKQDRLDDLTLQEVERIGGSNYCQSSYFRYLCVATIGSTNPKLESLQPNLAPELSQKSAAWDQALRLCLAFLRRRKMDQTLSAIRHEFSGCPRSTGYQHAADVDARMHSLLGITSKPGANSTLNETRDLNVLPTTPR